VTRLCVPISPGPGCVRRFKSHATLVERINDHHAFICRAMLDRIDALD
jgi:hypothetical protein